MQNKFFHLNLSFIIFNLLFLSNLNDREADENQNPFHLSDTEAGKALKK